jgi:hypothetical protein
MSLPLWQVALGTTILVQTANSSLPACRPSWRRT